MVTRVTRVAGAANARVVPPRWPRAICRWDGRRGSVRRTKAGRASHKGSVEVQARVARRPGLDQPGLQCFHSLSKAAPSPAMLRLSSRYASEFERIAALTLRSGSPPEIRLGDDQEVVAGFDDDLDSGILMARYNHETVGSLHGTLVFAERNLNRSPALRLVTLAHERHRLIVRRPAGLLNGSAPGVVGLERLLVLRCTLAARSPFGAHWRDANTAGVGCPGVSSRPVKPSIAADGGAPPHRDPARFTAPPPATDGFATLRGTHPG